MGDRCKGSYFAAIRLSTSLGECAATAVPNISLYWRRFTTRGAVWSMYGGLIMSVGLIIFSPVMSGTETSMIVNEVKHSLAHLKAWMRPRRFLSALLGAIVMAVVGWALARLA